MRIILDHLHGKLQLFQISRDKSRSFVAFSFTYKCYITLLYKRTMCKNTKTFFSLKIIAVVVVSLYLYKAVDEVTRVENDIDNVKSQGSDSRSLLCQHLCISYPYPMGDQCCKGYNKYPCQYKSICYSEYVQSQQDYLTGLQIKMVSYIIIDLILLLVFCLKLASKYCRNNGGQTEEERARNRALMALIVAARQNAANVQPNQEQRSILTQSFIAQDRTQNCAICLDTFQEQKVVGLNCRHLFHRVCIEDWLNKGDASCPVCRAPQ